MIEGFYKVSFFTQLSTGTGVAFLSGGSLCGSDSLVSYDGTYEIEGDCFHARILMLSHGCPQGVASAFGVERATLNVKGRVTDTGVNCVACADTAPDISMALRLERMRQDAVGFGRAVLVCAFDRGVSSSTFAS